MPSIELILGDCLVRMANIPDRSVDMLFADLPYGQTQCGWDTPIDLNRFWKEANRVCKEDAAMVFTTTTKYGAALISSNSANFRYDMVWKKSRPSGFLNAKRQPLRVHEMIYVFYRRQPPVYAQKIQERHVRKELYPVTRLNNVGIYGRYKKMAEARYEPPLPVSVIDVPTAAGKHNTQKPLALIDFFVRYYTREGETVLDPCMGSGSTGCSCVDLNRSFLGIEKDPAIFETAKKRIAEHSHVDAQL